MFTLLFSGVRRSGFPTTDSPRCGARVRGRAPGDQTFIKGVFREHGLRLSSFELALETRTIISVGNVHTSFTNVQ